MSMIAGGEREYLGIWLRFARLARYTRAGSSSANFETRSSLGTSIG